MTNDGKQIERSLDSDLESLLLGVLDNQASDGEFASLVASLRDSEELRKRACLFLYDETLLFSEIGATQQASILVEMLSLSESQRRVAVSADQAAATRRIPFGILHFINGNGLAIAAAALLIIFGLINYNMQMMAKLSRLHALTVQGNNKSEVEVVSAPQNNHGNGIEVLNGQEIVGRVIGLNNIQWQKGEESLTFGDSLREGQRLQIESGGLEILLTNGAKVTAEGPVDFEVTSLVMMELDLGKVVAAIPRTARGYTIMTPTSEVVDIGTQFGVAVDEAGDTELHVFDGDVVARSLVGENEAELIHAKENEAIGFNSKSSRPRRFAVRETDFIRRLGPKISESDYPSLPKTDCLSLWYAADMIPGVREGDAISTWRDILIGDNDFANDARQFDSQRCPTLAIDDQERHALRFNGWSTSLSTDPIENKGSTTVFVVCAPEQTSFSEKFHGGFLFKKGEAPSLELSVLSDLSVRGWLWPGPEETRVGIVRSSPMVDKQINVVAFTYDSDSSQSQMCVNGNGQVTANAPIPLRHQAQACIGSHSDLDINAYFFGNIYEIVVYDCTLDEQSMEDMNSYFEKRYKID